MKSLRSTAIVIVGAVAAVALAGVQSAGSRGPEPLDLSIAKKAQGPFKSNVQDSGPPGSNPQVQTRRVKGRKAGKYFVRLKNPGLNDNGAYLSADAGDSDFDVTYRLDGANVTGTVTDPNCPQYILDGKEKLLFTMKVKPTGAVPGEQATFGVTTIDPLCADPIDTVYAKVRVAAR